MPSEPGPATNSPATTPPEPGPATNSPATTPPEPGPATNPPATATSATATSATASSATKPTAIPAIESAEPPPGFESALSLIAAAVTLVTIADGRDDVGVTVSAFCPVSIRPPLILISLLEDSYPAELLGRIDRFAVTALASGQRALAGRFALAGRPGARLLLEDVPHHRGDFSGALIPDEGLLALECETVSRVPAGDHLLVIGLAQSFLPGKESSAPLIRFRGRYPMLA